MDINTLNELKAEKRRIEAKIRAIEEAAVYTKSKRVKAFLDPSRGYWNIAILPINNLQTRKIMYRTIVRLDCGTKKFDLVDPLNKIIIELTEMVDLLNEKRDSD